MPAARAPRDSSVAPISPDTSNNSGVLELRRSFRERHPHSLPALLGSISYNTQPNAKTSVRSRRGVLLERYRCAIVAGEIRRSTAADGISAGAAIYSCYIERMLEFG